MGIINIIQKKMEEDDDGNNNKVEERPNIEHTIGAANDAQGLPGLPSLPYVMKLSHRC